MQLQGFLGRIPLLALADVGLSFGTNTFGSILISGEAATVKDEVVVTVGDVVDVDDLIVEFCFGIATFRLVDDDDATLDGTTIT